MSGMSTAQLARLMVRFEIRIRHALEADDWRFAARLWDEREEVREVRSAMLRELWLKDGHE